MIGDAPTTLGGTNRDGQQHTNQGERIGIILQI